MINRPTSLIMLLTLALVAAVVPRAAAQRFTVASFKTLPNDVSAFINPVRDLNDEDCGLIKVMASEDFVFSTPLGIVKREDKTGEIWLYVPRGTKKLTIKHADWGVLRDYALPSRIESHMTYELRIDEPVRPGAVTLTDPVVTTVIDTLVVTRVDTLVVTPVRKIVPLNFYALATIGYGGRSGETSEGIMLMALKRHGGFIRLMTDFGRTGATIGDCDRSGEIDGVKPFYSGRTRRSTFTVNAGAAHRLSGKVTIFEGIGYGHNALAWELAPSEGGGWVKNSYYSTGGVSFEAGTVVTFGRVAVLASVITIKGSQWFGSAGLGIRIGK